MQCAGNSHHIPHCSTNYVNAITNRAIVKPHMSLKLCVRVYVWLCRYVCLCCCECVFVYIYVCIWTYVCLLNWVLAIVAIIRAEVALPRDQIHLTVATNDKQRYPYHVGRHAVDLIRHVSGVLRVGTILCI